MSALNPDPLKPADKAAGRSRGLLTGDNTRSGQRTKANDYAATSDYAMIQYGDTGGKMDTGRKERAERRAKDPSVKGRKDVPVGDTRLRDLTNNFERHTAQVCDSIARVSSNGQY